MPRGAPSCRRLLAIAALLSSSACGAQGGDAAPADDVLALIQALHRGDTTAQGPLVAPEDRNAHGTRVLRVHFPPDRLRHFRPSRAELMQVKDDTAGWVVWGTEPDYSGVDFSTYEYRGGMRMPTGVREPSDAEIAALPRQRGSWVVLLARRPDGWKLPLESTKLGPLLMLMDSIDARCPIASDPRPCRADAERLARTFTTVPPELRGRFAHIAGFMEDRVRQSQAMDSLRLEVMGERVVSYGNYTAVDVAVVNRSSVPLKTVFFRVLDAEGSVLLENWSTTDLPARGRRETMMTVEGRSFPRPLRLELDWVVLREERP